MMYTLGRSLVAFPIMRILCRFKVEGVEHIPQKGGFILASNHASYLDPLALGVACPRKLSFMAKEELFRNPLFARVLKQVGAFPVRRESADTSALKEAIRRVRSGKALVLFPEGERKASGAPDKEPQAGVGFLAQKSGVPVIPAFIDGTQRALPRGARIIRPARILVRFGTQVAIEEKMPYPDAASLIMKGIRQLQKEISS